MPQVVQRLGPAVGAEKTNPATYHGTAIGVPERARRLLSTPPSPNRSSIRKPP